MTEKEFGKNLKHLRIERSMTQEEISKRIGITREHYSRWERGITMPKTQMIYVLADVLCCKYDDIFIPKYVTKVTNENLH